MRLSMLADRAPGGAQVIGPDASVADVTHDSRLVKEGDLFVALPGLVTDGHRFVDDAIAAGAAAVAVEHAGEGPYSQLVVDDARLALGPLASAVHGEPSHRLAVVGVTGTNGKTTVTYFVESIVAAAGRVPGVVGTVGARIAGEHLTLPRTTPEASDLQRLLADMVKAGVDVAAVEVSSHALALHRVNGVWFRVAAFTNLMQDHLDFHHDMEAYFAAKRSLFEPGRVERAVVSIDDDAGRAIASDADIAVTTVALDGRADVTATDLSSSLAGSSFTLHGPDASYQAWIPLPGRFNVGNALIAAAIATELGIDHEAVIAGLAEVGSIPGRFESVEVGRPYDVVVDYAHTPAAVAAVIESARSLTDGKIIALIGAGGDRDQDKRAAMGAAAAAADVVVLTSDNPRSEDPDGIIEAVASGIPPTVETITEPDRRLAIRTAGDRARAGDLVLILGKGHETGQEVAGAVLPFDDRLVVGEEIGAANGGAGS